MVNKRIQSISYHCYLCAVLPLEGRKKRNNFSQITSGKSVIITVE